MKFKNPFSVSNKESSAYVKKCLNIGHKLCLQNKIKGIINCPINKRNLFKEKNLGITEFLAQKNKVSVFPIHEYWLDVGQKNDFNQADIDYRKHKAKNE